MLYEQVKSNPLLIDKDDWNINGSFFTLFMIDALQEYCLRDQSIRQGLLFYQQVIEHIISQVDKQPDCSNFLILHYSELLSLVVHPLTPITHSFLSIINSLLVRYLSSSSTLIRAILVMWPSFVVTLTNIHKTCDECECITGITLGDVNRIDSIVNSWMKDVKPDTVNSVDHSSSIQQLILNSTSLACYHHNPDVAKGWRRVRATLLSQWKLKDESHTGKRVKTREGVDPLPEVDAILHSLICPYSIYGWCYRCYISNGPLVSSVAHIVTQLLSLAVSSSIRQRASVLTALQKIIQVSPHMIIQPPFLRMLTNSLSSHQAVIIERVIALLGTVPLIVVSQPLLVRTAVAVGLKQSSRSVRVQTMQFVANCEQAILNKPIDSSAAALLKHLAQQSLKHLVTETDPAVIPHCRQALLLLWTDSHAHLPTLQHLIEVVDECQDSLVPSDIALRSTLITTLSFPEVHDALLIIYQSTISRLQETPSTEDLHLLLALLDTAQIPVETSGEVVLTLLCNTKGKQLFLSLQLTARVLKKTELQVEFESELSSLLIKVDTVEGIQRVIHCLMIQAQIHNSMDSLRSILKDCLLAIQSDPEDSTDTNRTLLRSVVIIGHVYQELTRSLYNSLFEDELFHIRSVSSTLEAILLNTTIPLLIRLYAFESCCHCLLHSSTGISLNMLNWATEVDSGEELNIDDPEGTTRSSRIHY